MVGSPAEAVGVERHGSLGMLGSTNTPLATCFRIVSLKLLSELLYSFPKRLKSLLHNAAISYPSYFLSGEMSK